MNSEFCMETDKLGIKKIKRKFLKKKLLKMQEDFQIHLTKEKFMGFDKLLKMTIDEWWPPIKAPFLRHGFSAYGSGSWLKSFQGVSAPSLWKGSRPPRARPWSWPPVLGSVLAPGLLLETVSAPVHRNPPCWLKELYLLLPLYHHFLVDLGDNAGGGALWQLWMSPSTSAFLSAEWIYSNCTAFHVYIIQFTICIVCQQIYIWF